MKVICPYKEEGKKKCVHKMNRSLKGCKKYCNYKFPHNCPLYQEWLEKSEKVSPGGFKTRYSAIEKLR